MDSRRCNLPAVTLLLLLACHWIGCSAGESCSYDATVNGVQVTRYVFCDYGCCGTTADRKCCSEGVSETIIIVACALGVLIVITVVVTLIICIKGKKSDRVQRVRIHNRGNGVDIVRPATQIPKPPPYSSAPPAYSETARDQRPEFGGFVLHPPGPASSGSRTRQQAVRPSPSVVAIHRTLTQRTTPISSRGIQFEEEYDGSLPGTLDRNAERTREQPQPHTNARRDRLTISETTDSDYDPQTDVDISTVSGTLDSQNTRQSTGNRQQPVNTRDPIPARQTTDIPRQTAPLSVSHGGVFTTHASREPVSVQNNDNDEEDVMHRIALPDPVSTSRHVSQQQPAHTDTRIPERAALPGNPRRTPPRLSPAVYNNSAVLQQQQGRRAISPTARRQEVLRSDDAPPRGSSTRGQYSDLFQTPTEVAATRSRERNTILTQHAVPDRHAARDPQRRQVPASPPPAYS